MRIRERRARAHRNPAATMKPMRWSAPTASAPRSASNSPAATRCGCPPCCLSRGAQARRDAGRPALECGDDLGRTEMPHCHYPLQGGRRSIWSRLRHRSRECWQQRARKREEISADDHVVPKIRKILEVPNEGGAGIGRSRSDSRLVDGQCRAARRCGASDYQYFAQGACMRWRCVCLSDKFEKSARLQNPLSSFTRPIAFRAPYRVVLSSRETLVGSTMPTPSSGWCAMPGARQNTGRIQSQPALALWRNGLSGKGAVGRCRTRSMNWRKRREEIIIDALANAVELPSAISTPLPRDLVPLWRACARRCRTTNLIAARSRCCGAIKTASDCCCSRRTHAIEKPSGACWCWQIRAWARNMQATPSIYIGLQRSCRARPHPITGIRRARPFRRGSEAATPSSTAEKLPMERGDLS